jgi:glyoxylase-like metal-dependent hydrolase (beta-lactamase superfamily II)
MIDRDVGYRILDLEHLGRTQSVAACLVETAAGPLLVDPGPTVSLPRLRAGLARRGYALEQLGGLLLTHIHLDHAGASGVLVREVPGLRVYVHEAGAPHLIDPTKLLNSATRLYGDRMAELWGEVAAVPAERVTVLRGGERLRFGERVMEVAYTPGHATHHVCYFDPASRTAFVGDTAGIYGPAFPVVLPVTPPPDFDLEAWLASIARILEWHPDQIVLTHFGPGRDPQGHFEELRAGLLAWAELTRVSLAKDGSDADRAHWFAGQLEEWIDGKVAPELAKQYLAGAGPEACWQGMARYWRKR